VSDRPDPVEDRVRTALHAEVDAVTPDGGSLPAIHRRVRTVRRRRRALALAGTAVAAVAAALLVPLGRDGGSDVSTGPDRATTTMSAPAPTAGAADAAVWPDPTAGELFDAPEDAVASFAAALLGVDDPPVAATRRLDPDRVEVDLLDRTESGVPRATVASTVSVGRLDGEHWFVTAARSDDVRVDAPTPGATASSVLRVVGEGRGFEATIVAALHARTAPAPVLAEQATTAGTAAPAPFSVDLAVPADRAGVAVLVVRDAPGAEASVPHATVLPVLLAPPASPAPGPATPSPTVTTGRDGADFALGAEPLWPFRTFEDAEAWRATAAEGHQPWHLDAATTAQMFTRSFLGFTEIDEVTSQDVRADEAWIGVGSTIDGAATPAPPVTAAVVHLVRFGPGPDSPWEVVGTRDTVLTLDTPAYGAAVGSPTTVGGTITGVDESVHVRVLQVSSPTPLGESCCTPAGGEGTPWSTTVSWTGATDPALTIVASTGGHVQQVESFAITGIPGPG